MKKYSDAVKHQSFSVSTRKSGTGVLLYCKSFIDSRLLRPGYGFFFKSGELTFPPGLRDGCPQALAEAQALLKLNLKQKYSIAGNCEKFAGGGDSNFSGRRAAVVAHWDPHNMVDPYVEYMCRHLKRMGYKVILTTAARLSPNEPLSRWNEWCDTIIYRSCAGYDFTSWKAAFHCLPSLFECENLILCNDSVFAPIGSFEAVHAKMKKINCDFWGMSASPLIAPHLQSFYLVFSRPVLQHEAFKQFFDAVPISNNREKAVACETSLTLWLGMHGFSAAAYQIARWDKINRIDPTIHAWSGCLNNGMPLIKRRLLLQTAKAVDWESRLRRKNYPVELIKNYFSRCGFQ